MKKLADIDNAARRFVLFAVLGVASFSVFPQNQLVDKKSGLAVRLPAGFAVVLAPPRPRQDVLFSIRAESGQPVAKNRDGTLCGLAFANAPSNAKLSQDEINVFSHNADWRNVAKATLEMVFDVQRVDSIKHSGIDGITMQAVPKAGFPDQDLFMHISLLETPKGRTTLACVTSQGNAAAAMPVFESILAGVKTPR